MWISINGIINIIPNQIKSLNADLSDVNSTFYQSIKRGLTNFKKNRSGIEYAYIFRLKDEVMLEKTIYKAILGIGIY